MSVVGESEFDENFSLSSTFWLSCFLFVNFLIYQFMRCAKRKRRLLLLNIIGVYQRRYWRLCRYGVCGYSLYPTSEMRRLGLFAPFCHCCCSCRRSAANDERNERTDGRRKNERTNERERTNEWLLRPANAMRVYVYKIIRRTRSPRPLPAAVGQASELASQPASAQVEEVAVARLRALQLMRQKSHTYTAASNERRLCTGAKECAFVAGHCPLQRASLPERHARSPR